LSDAETSDLGKHLNDSPHLLNIEIASEVGPQSRQSVRFEKLEAPFPQLGQIARINAKAFEGTAPCFGRSCRHRRVHRTHVHVDRVEQQRRAVGIRVEPAFEGDLLEVFWLAGARFDLRFG
jgi:hypothetical protein